jgi:hypothetical protein
MTHDKDENQCLIAKVKQLKSAKKRGVRTSSFEATGAAPGYDVRTNSNLEQEEVYDSKG